MEKVLPRIASVLKRPAILISLNWLSQFGIFVAIIFFGGVGAAHGLVTLTLTPERMIEIYGFADAGSYLQGAMSLVEHGRNIEEWHWILNLWPPGMMWLFGSVIVISSTNFGIIVALVNCAFWATAFSVVIWPLLRTKAAVVVVLVAEMAILSTSPFQSWMLDEGLFYADGLASASFLLGFAIFVNRSWFGGQTWVWVRDGIFAGLAFTAALYFRASYNLVPWVLVAVAVLVSLSILRRRKKRLDAARIGRQAISVAVAAVTILLLCAPYAAYSLRSRDRIQFVETENLVYQHVWEDPKTVDIPQWMLDGGSTLGCDLDQKQCEAFEESTAKGKPPSVDEERTALIGAIFENPGEFVGNRVSTVVHQWFRDELSSFSYIPQNHESGNVSYAGSPNYNAPQGFLYLAFLIVAIVAATGLATKRKWIYLIIPLAALAILAPFSIVHVEVRYLIPLKMLGLLAPTLLFAWKFNHLLRPSFESIEPPLDEKDPQ